MEMSNVRTVALFLLASAHLSQSLCISSTPSRLLIMSSNGIWVEAFHYCDRNSTMHVTIAYSSPFTSIPAGCLPNNRPF